MFYFISVLTTLIQSVIMNWIKTHLNSLGRTTRTGLLALAVVFISAGIAQAATTISTNVSTDGTLGVTGLSSLGQASTTMLSANRAYFGQTATTTIDTAGNAAIVGTLGVTGLSSLSQATSTMFSAHTAYFGQTATSTFDSAGNLAVIGTLGVTGATTLASTTATGMKVGQVGTRMTRIVSGYCATDASALTASTTTMLTCTPSGGTGVIASGDRVFVTATSSLPGRVYLQAASSTSAGTIQVNAFNTAIDGGTVGSAVYAFNFWAFQ